MSKSMEAPELTQPESATHSFHDHSPQDSPLSAADDFDVLLPSTEHAAADATQGTQMSVSASHSAAEDVSNPPTVEQSIADGNAEVRLRPSEEADDSSEASFALSWLGSDEEPILTDRDYPRGNKLKLRTSISQLAKAMEMYVLCNTSRQRYKVSRLVKYARTHGIGGVRVLPMFVQRARSQLGICSTRLIAIIGAPWGLASLNSKRIAALTAIEDSADEIEWVINLKRFEHEDWSGIENELEVTLEVARNNSKTFSVNLNLFEYCRMTVSHTDEQITMQCRICARLKVDFVSYRGEDGPYCSEVQLMLDIVENSGVEIKMQMMGSGFLENIFSGLHTLASVESGWMEWMQIFGSKRRRSVVWATRKLQ